MEICRRTLLRSIVSGAAATAAASTLRPASLSAASAADEAWPTGGADGPIRLHLSENPYGPSPAAIAAIRDSAAGHVHRYPDAAEQALRNRLAEFHRVTPEQIVVGCGSREILRMAATVFCGAGRSAVVAAPTHAGLMTALGNTDTEIVAVPLGSNYSFDLDRMLARADHRTGLVYLCNPHNPIGSLTPRAEIEAFVENIPAATYVVIDEAYHHFVGGAPEYASFIDRAVSNPRVIVTRSFSTMHGLAGLRVGYGITSPETARALAPARLAGGVNALGAMAAMAALTDSTHVRNTARRNADERQEFCNQANARMLRTIDSQANFVMLNTGHAAADVIAHFERHGVLVAGPFAGYDKHVRVSIGTPADMREFWRVWDLLPPMHAMTM
jgi:histidinol-phosphate aminotransferase